MRTACHKSVSAAEYFFLLQRRARLLGVEWGRSCFSVFGRRLGVPLGNSTIGMVLLLVTTAVVLNLAASACSMQSFIYNASQKTLHGTVAAVAAVRVHGTRALQRLSYLLAAFKVDLT